MIRWNRWVNMAVAHIRRHADAANFELVFRYQNRDVGVDRVFNFQRNVAETIASTLNRIKTNVEKEHNKKLKKTKKAKKGETSDNSSSNTGDANKIDIDFLIDKNESTTWLDVFGKFN